MRLFLLSRKPRFYFIKLPQETDKVYFEYEIKNTSIIQFSLFDISGKQIHISNIGKQAVGKQIYTISKNELNVIPGVYFYQFNINGNSSTGKVIFD